MSQRPLTSLERPSIRRGRCGCESRCGYVVNERNDRDRYARDPKSLEDPGHVSFFLIEAAPCPRNSLRVGNRDIPVKELMVL
jgi:hypothetical protein